MATDKTINKTGRRKTSVARASVKKGKGLLRINNENPESYFSSELNVLKVQEPLILADASSKYDIMVRVFGGGVNSQTEAIRQAIARALVEIGGEATRKKFLDYDRSLLVSDTRFKEMKKPNNSHARAKRQKSYR